MSAEVCRQIVGEAQHNVESLCCRFSNLFAQFHQEEEGLRAARLQISSLERRLELVRCDELGPLGGAGVDACFAGEAVALRREAASAEQRAAIAGGEAGVHAAAAESYAKQALRLQERWAHETKQEQEYRGALLHSSAELSGAQRGLAEVGTELRAVEQGEQRLQEDVRKESQGAEQAAAELQELRRRLARERGHGELLEEEQNRGQTELSMAEGDLCRAREDLEAAIQQLEAERLQARRGDDLLRDEAAKRAKLEERACELSLVVSAQHSAGCAAKASWESSVSKARGLRAQLQAEQRRCREEQETSGASSVRLSQSKSVLAVEESEKDDAEAELLRLRKLAAEFEERCRAQLAWREEMQKKRSADEVALERLREELRSVSADRTRLQKEVDEIDYDKTKLEVELQVTLPALQEVLLRGQSLESRVAARSREIAQEAERLRSCEREAALAEAQVQAAARRADNVGVWSQTGRAGAASRTALPGRGGLEVGRPCGACPAPVVARPLSFTPMRPRPGELPAIKQEPAAWRSPGVFHSASLGDLSRSDTRPLPALAPGSIRRADDAVRYLCEYVAREEERLGLTPRLTNSQTWGGRRSFDPP